MCLIISIAVLLGNLIAFRLSYAILPQRLPSRHYDALGLVRREARLLEATVGTPSQETPAETEPLVIPSKVLGDFECVNRRECEE